MINCEVLQSSLSLLYFDCLSSGLCVLQQRGGLELPPVYVFRYEYIDHCRVQHLRPDNAEQ